MSAMSQLSAQLQELQELAWDASVDLEARLQEISDLLWQDEQDSPLFHASDELIQLLDSINSSLATPVGEIKAARLSGK